MAKLYNPLDKFNLARSIEAELLKCDPVQIKNTHNIVGAGIYVLYYSGPISFYSPIKADPEVLQFDQPIYVGKAIPKGSRKGGLTKDAAKGNALADRLKHHAASVADAKLGIENFWVRYLVVDDVWIPLGENMLIETYKPVWNQALDGFGNKTPGKGRHNQIRPMWDTLHPGRSKFDELRPNPLTYEFLAKRVEDHLAGRPLAALPKAVKKQIVEEKKAAEEEADEVEF